MKNIFKSIHQDKVAASLFWLVLAITFLPRFFYIKIGLPHYSIDENDIVEFALGYLGGDLDPHWYKYGPLYSYLLAIVFKIQSFFYSGNLNDFAHHYFQDSTNFYYSARFLNSIIHIALAFLSYAITFKFLSKKAAPFALIIGLVPFADSLTNYTIRVDSLLALNLSLALYFILHLFRKEKTKWYILTGIFVGFAFGTKPLPSLMVLPAIYLAWFLATLKATHFGLKNIGEHFLKSFINPRLYLLVISILLGLFISHPYAIINLMEFISEQKSVISDDSGFGYTKGYVLSRFFGSLGIPFVLICSILILFGVFFSIKFKKWPLLVLITFVITYWGAFSGVPARDYFYIPLLPILGSIAAYFPFHYKNKFNYSHKNFQVLWCIFFIVFAFKPLETVFQKIKNYGITSDKLKRSSSIIAENWILSNIPNNSKLLYYGYYVSLPRLIDPNPNEQAQYGEYFMYYRSNNEFLKNRFIGWHNQYLQNGFPTYDLIYQLNVSKSTGNQSYYTRYEMGEDEQYLLSSARQAGAEYIVTSYNLEKYPEFQNLRVWSSMGKGSFGGDINIYKIQ
jgi:hypothetical protein